MKQEVNPKLMAIIIAVLVVILSGIGYRVFFYHPPALEDQPVKAENKRFMHPSGPDSPPAGAPTSNGG